MLRTDRGLTLVELLIAVSITGLLSFSITRTISTAQTTIDRSTAQTVGSVQTVRFVGLLKYDIAGATDLFAFDSTAPTSGAALCSTWPSGNAAAWNEPTNPQFVRSLFTVEIPTLTPPASPGAAQTFAPKRTQRVGYELRRQSTTAANYDLYRVVCDDGQVSQRVLSLGSDLPVTASGLTALRCYNAAGSAVAISAGTSTMSGSIPIAQRCASFGFLVPYTGTANAIRRLLGDTTLQRMTSAVTP